MVFFGFFKNKEPIKVSKYTKAAIGGASGILATIILHPLDLVKTRMQLYPRRVSTIRMARKICRCEGPKALYIGLTAATVRQATYTTSRIAVYHWLYDKYRASYGIPTLTDKVAIGMYASMAGGFVGLPPDVVLARMMADVQKDPCSLSTVPYRRFYKGPSDCVKKIIHMEGVRTLWRGGTIALVRAACVGVVQVGSYVQTREYLMKHMKLEGTWLHVFTSFVSGFVTAIVTLPIDRVKIRYQMRRDRLSYREVIESIYKCGGRSFWAGFIPYFLRLSVHTSLTYIFMQNITETYLDHLKNKAEGSKTHQPPD